MNDNVTKEYCGQTQKLMRNEVTIMKWIFGIMVAVLAFGIVTNIRTMQTQKIMKVTYLEKEEFRREMKTVTEGLNKIKIQLSGIEAKL